MPLFRINDQFHYFAHVPKCGGTSVEVYLAERFGPLALKNITRFSLPPDQRWSRTSPQHVPASVLPELFPPEWITSSFAVVRHPVRRLISAFCYARDKNKHLPLSTDFDAWFREASGWILREPYRLDGHFAPQTSFVPDGARIFRMEDGLEALVPYLDQLAGNQEGPRSLPALNIGTWRANEDQPHPSPETLALIQQVYAEDFARFAYAPASTDEALAQLPDLPALSATGRPPAPPRRSLKTRVVRALYRKAGL